MPTNKGMTRNGYKCSLRDNENILELDCGGSYATL